MAQPLFDAEAVHTARLSDLVDVVSSGTVSRALLVTPGFRQILFSMDAGQEMSDHRAPFLAIVQVVSGRLWLRAGERDHLLQDGDWLCMPPDAPHALRAESATRFLLTLVRVPPAAAGTRVENTP